MGAASSSESRPFKKPADIAEFRQLTEPLDDFIIPEVPEKRKVTDFKFTVTFGICLIILVPFLIYTFVYSDTDRFVHGFDDCGNICGEKNSPIEGIPCSGQDRTNQPFVRFTRDENRFREEDELVHSKCVESCGSDYQIIMNRCVADFEKDSIQAIAQMRNDINRSAGYIVALCFIGFGFCIGMLFLFRYFVVAVVWVILIGSIIGVIVLTGFLWYFYQANSTSKGFLYLAIFFSVLSVVLVVMLICMFKKIQLVIRLFKESIKIIFGMPLILFQPLLTLVATTILFTIFIFFIMIWATAGSLQLVGDNIYRFVPNGGIMFTIFYHSVICLWMLQFIVGCQHMVIAGAVSAYYFARDKSSLVSPIYNSFYNLIRYHLGTVAFGSLIITVFTIIRALIRSLTNNKLAKVLIDYCLGAIEDFLKYLSKNAYIQTAMHGQPFFKSGKRAVRLLAANFLSVIAVNSVGDFILNMAKLLIVLCTIGVGVLMNDDDIEYFYIGVAIAALVTAIMADCFFSVFETAVDTIFLCFCEDSCINNGMDRPYYMNTNLMQYMEEAKQTYKDKSANN